MAFSQPIQNILATPAQDVYDQLADTGILIFRAPQARLDLVNWFDSLFVRLDHRDSDPDGVTEIRTKPQAPHLSGQGFTRNHLPLHVDGAAEPTPPPIILLYMKVAPAFGGTPKLVDGKSVCRSLHQDEFAALSHPQAADIGRPPSLLPVLESTSPGRIIIRFRGDGLTVPRRDHFTHMALKAFESLCARDAVDLPLSSGEGYLIHNHRWLHGRAAYSGDRVVWRLLGSLPGVRPAAALNGGFPMASPESW